MSVVDQIFQALGGTAAIAKETGFPMQTVSSWRSKGDIPHWRRAAIIDAAQRLGKPLEPSCAAYLASRERAAA